MVIDASMTGFEPVDAGAPEFQAALRLVDETLDAEQRQRRIPGMSAAVVLDQDLIWAQGYGYADIEAQVPATPETIYRVGSITKLFTATMLMQLRDAGKLHLDDPIERYLPGFKIASPFPDPQPPTFRQVVSHSAGLPREAPLDYWQTLTFPDIDTVLASLKDTQIVFPPSTQFKYSNLGIGILGNALARIAGQPYREYITERILRPLGMTHTSFEPTNELAPYAAVGYHLKDGEPAVAEYPMIGAFEPAGQLASSVVDLAKFISLQFRHGPASQNGVLGGTSLREMHNPVIMSPDWEFGLGIGFLLSRHNGHRTIGHGGGIHGFTTNFVAVTDLALGAIVFTNTETAPNELTKIMLDILMPVATRMKGREQRERERAAAGETHEEWRIYVGKYALSGLSEVDVKLSGGKLLISSGDTPEQTIRLTPEAEHQFRMQGGPSAGELATFVLDEAGAVTMLRVGDYPFARVE